jgi:hypothetical protein
MSRKSPEKSSPVKRAPITENSGTISAFPNLKPFPKGVSGNPGGKPRRIPLSDVIREELEKKNNGKAVNNVAIARKLIQMALAGNLDAIREIADRVEGKPRQRSEITGADGAPLFEAPGTREELERRLAVLLNKGGSEMHVEHNEEIS